MYDFFNGIITTVGAYVPKVLGAILLLVIAWIVAAVARKLTKKFLLKIKMDKHLSKGTEPYNPEQGKERVSAISKMIYLLVFILFCQVYSIG